MDTTTLARYADAIVRDGLQIGPGDLLAVHGDPAHRDLVVALAEAGYRAGASHVDSLSVDPRVTKARALGADPGSLDWRPAWEDERMQAIVRPAISDAQGVEHDDGPVEFARPFQRALECEIPARPATGDAPIQDVVAPALDLALVERGYPQFGDGTHGVDGIRASSSSRAKNSATRCSAQ